MIFKILFLSSIIFSLMANAESTIGFKGCGEYHFRGVLQKNNKENLNKGLVVYVVNGKTHSEMQFTINDVDDLVRVSSYLNIPTAINAYISKNMDGTRGEINHISKIALRKSNPLDPINDTGIFLISKKECL